MFDINLNLLANSIQYSMLCLLRTWYKLIYNDSLRNNFVFQKIDIRLQSGLFHFNPIIPRTFHTSVHIQKSIVTIIATAHFRPWTHVN